MRIKIFVLNSYEIITIQEGRNKDEYEKLIAFVKSRPFENEAELNINLPDKHRNKKQVTKQNK